ncbi:MAG: adenylate/guanylate cyclase domain-containing protein [Actinomycetota bacterium]|nr:adenylate/guanylate cyclase domain-containing protein [Actinomycetota bacterium]
MVEDAEEALQNQIKLRLMLAGVPPERVEGIDGDRARGLLREKILWGDGGRITIEELAERSGLPLDVCRRARMLLGLPDPGDQPVCRVQEVEAFRGFAQGMALYGAEPVMQFVRVLGSALANVAEGSLSVFARTLTGDTDGDQLEGDAYTIAAFDALESFRIVPMALQIITKLQFDQAIERLTGDPGQPVWYAVGFVDLAGSTKSTERLGSEVMSGALTRFEEWAVELTTAHHGRVVKYIGDEVMFICPDLVGAAAVASGLIDRAEGDDVLGTARGGLAFGPLLSRDGDWYGSTVNLAARLVEKAKPGCALLTGEGAELVPGAVHKGRKRLRDIQERPDVWRLG